MHKRINPDGLFTPQNYHHVVVAEPGRSIYIAGQLALDADRNFIGGDDVVAQTRQALKNLGTALAAAGAKPSDVVKITTYVVDYRREQLAGIAGEIGAFFSPEACPANTLIGVDCLAADGLLIEIEAVAVVQ